MRVSLWYILGLPGSPHPQLVLLVTKEQNGSSPEFRQLVHSEDIVSERVTLTTSLIKVSI